jgi:hypothetical protein
MDTAAVGASAEFFCERESNLGVSFSQYAGVHLSGYGVGYCQTSHKPSMAGAVVAELPAGRHGSQETSTSNDALVQVIIL